MGGKLTRWLLALLLWLAAGPAIAQQVEVTRDFAARIEIQADGALIVTEEIEVLALGQAIRRGIYRDYDLRPIDPAGIFRAGFQVLEATRNGEAETYRTERIGGGVRVYLGRSDAVLPHGVHRYRLRFRMENEVRAFEGFDEVYWNVNGTGWAFPVLRLSAEVVLPPGATATRRSAYTGRAGERGGDARITEPGDGRVEFRATRPLAAGENLTIAVGFPQGFVSHDARHGALHWLLNRSPLQVGGVVLALLLAYYGFVWHRVGRDPRGGPIIPVYQPSLPPAAMRFIERMGFDPQCLSAAVISLAVKGHVTIGEDASRKIILTRAVPPPGAPEPSAGEAVLLQQLLGGRGSITLEQGNHAALSTARSALRRHLDATFNRVFFRRNTGWKVLGVLITLLGWAAMALTHPHVLAVAPFVLMVGAFSGAALHVPLRLARDVRQWRAGVGFREALGLVMAAVSSLVIIGFTLFGIFFAVEVMGWEMVAGTVALVAVNVVFHHLLKAPTPTGRQALDEIEGTRLYLTVAEAERLRFHNPPDRTPEHFEALLPYAVALDVETAWTRQFSDVLARAATSPEGYQPRWYRGGRYRGSGLSGLGRALASSYGSAARSPSSSRSGSGGGGFSGGGGGSRGGGGW
ncbi:DUF2207 domain-containing protein [Roseococcus thiosulfatophilus]|uniref:DUF2207 domain-containing protein n=1 Tax=Roseococcus thiosulfatophilus TaxID=35813 RepID=UPI001A8F6717|nr:DUF2207 domain-containing protein [Roseococcus thiosulfatophilus]